MTRTHHILVFLVLFSILFPSICLSEETITGQYCYTYGDRETIQESRELVRKMSIRNGIESYRIFIESSTKVENFSLSNDLIQTISSGYLKNLKVLEHTEEGRTICEKISGTVEPREIEKIMKKEVEKRTKKVEQKGLDDNGYVKILSVSKSQTEDKTRSFVNLKLKSLRKFQSDNEYCNVFITYYDSEGNEMFTDKQKKCFYKVTFYSDKPNLSITEKIDHLFEEIYEVEDIYPGETRNCGFEIKDYPFKVWLYGSQSESTTAKQVKKRTSNKK